MIEKIQIWGSLQAHRVIENIEGGYALVLGQPILVYREF